MDIDVDSLNRPQDDSFNINERRVLGKVRLGLKELEPLLRAKIPADAGSVSEINTALLDILQDKNQPAELRTAAADAIGKVRSILCTHPIFVAPEETQTMLNQLIVALQDAVLQLSALACLRMFAPEETSVILPVLLDGLISTARPEVVAAALATVRECDPFLVVHRLDNLMPFLSYDDVSVRCEAYAVFGRLGKVAPVCLPVLVKRLREEQDGPALYELVRALVLIDRTGDRLLHYVRRTKAKQTENLKRGKKSSQGGEERLTNLVGNAHDENDQDKLLRLLRLLQLRVEIGEVWTWYLTLSEVRKILETHWNRPTAPPGYQRMNVDHINGYIFPSGQQVDPRTIQNWMEARILTAIHQAGNLYDVKVADLCPSGKPAISGLAGRAGSRGRSDAGEAGAVVPGEPVLGCRGNGRGVPLERGEVIVGIGRGEFAGVDQAHVKVADGGAMPRFVEQRVLAMQDRLL